MSVKSYTLLWVLFAFAAVGFFAAGYLTMLAIVVFGFVAFGLTFIGMMNVLPLMVSHPAPETPEIQPAVALQPMRETPAKAFGVLKSA